MDENTLCGSSGNEEELSPKKKTRVVNLKHEEYDVYIGRPGPFGNIFHIGRDGIRSDVLQKFETHVRTNPAFIEKIKRELTGKTLGCFCKPKPCHGDIYVAICEETTLFDKMEN